MSDRGILNWANGVSIGSIGAPAAELATRLTLLSVPLTPASAISALEKPGPAPYQPQAILPDLPRRAVVELAGSVATDSLCDGVHAPHVAIVAFPDPVMEAVWDLGIPFASSRQSLHAIQGEDRFDAFLRLLLDEILSLFPATPEASLQQNGVCITDAGLLTVTENSLTRDRIGLHVDSWDRQSLAQRRRSQPRICMNLSNQDRLFFFHPTPVYDLWVARGSPEGPGNDATNFVRDFVRNRHEEVEVAAVNVPPGCAYWALTENLIHDASTFFRTQLDVNYTVRGDFYLSDPRSAAGREAA